MIEDEFTQPLEAIQGKTKQLNLEDTTVSKRDASPMDRSAPRPWRIALTVSKLSLQIVVDLHGELVMGRASRDDDDGQALLDLTPFNAHEQGVSRRHAQLFLLGEQVLVIDSESVNGTFLNGEALTPNQEYPLRHGDRLRLGKLELKVEMLSNPYSMM